MKQEYKNIEDSEAGRNLIWNKLCALGYKPSEESLDEIMRVSYNLGVKTEQERIVEIVEEEFNFEEEVSTDAWTGFDYDEVKEKIINKIKNND